MKVGDLVRNIHTVRGSEADEHGIIVGLSLSKVSSQRTKFWWREKDGNDLVKVMWFPNGLVEYMTWMDKDDLEVLCK